MSLFTVVGTGLIVGTVMTSSSTVTVEGESLAAPAKRMRKEHSSTTHRPGSAMLAFMLMSMLSCDGKQALPGFV